MSVKEFTIVVDKWWSEICQYVNGCLLFLDDAAAESLHWHGGLNRLLDSGAQEVRNFSVFEEVPPIYKKVVFIITSPINNNVLRTLMTIIQSSAFRSCVVITSLPSKCHDICSIGGHQGFHNLELQLLNWMQNMNYTAHVVQIPVFAACLLPEVFIMPPFANYFLPFSAEASFLRTTQKAEAGSKSVPDDLQSSVTAFASCFYTMLDSLNVKGDIFSLGKLSHAVAAELENIFHTSKKKQYPVKASVILLDRSLDLAGPLSQATDTTFGKMLRVLPHLPGHVCDVYVPMIDLASCKSGDVYGWPLLAPGCIAHKYNPNESDVLSLLFTKKAKEAMMEINRKIVQVAVAEGLTYDNTNINAPKMLKKKVISFKEKPHLLHKYSGLLQQALGVVEAMEHPSAQYFDNLLAMEKLLVQNFNFHKIGVVEDIVRLIDNRNNSGYKLADILTLIAFLYVLSNSAILDKEAEASLQATVMEAMFQQNADAEDLVRYLAGDDADNEEILAAVKTFFVILKRVADLRKDCKKYGQNLSYGNHSILKQMIGDIIKSSEIPDLEFHSGGLRDYIKTGFSLFMNVAKPQPKDNPLIIIFVLGGISASEIKMVHDMAAQCGDIKILLGSTNLLTPFNVMSDLFNTVNQYFSKEDSVEL